MLNDSRHKIIQVVASYKPAYIYGGPIMSVAKLCEVLNRKFQRFEAKEYPSSTSSLGARLEVYTTTANGDEELPLKHNKPHNIDGVTVTFFKRLTKDHSHFSPSLLIALFSCLKNKNCTYIIHIQAWWNLISVLSCVVALLKKSPVMLSPRGTLSNYSFNNRTSFFKKIFHHLIGLPLLKRCHFHVTSEKEKHDILRLLTPLSITVIPNFVELPEQKEIYVSQLSKKISFESAILYQNPSIKNGIVHCKQLHLLFLSRIEEKKGLDLLLKALANIDIPWSLKIAGNGNPVYLKKLKNLIQELQLDNNRITWLGHKSNEEKFDLLKDHDLLVLPSYDENFANVVIESIAMGTPVLVSSKVGLADYVLKNNLGFTCEPEPESIKQGIEYFFTHQGDFNTHIFNKIIKRDFNEEKLVQQYLDLYQSLN